MITTITVKDVLKQLKLKKLKKKWLEHCTGMFNHFFRFVFLVFFEVLSFQLLKMIYFTVSRSHKSSMQGNAKAIAG